MKLKSKVAIVTGGSKGIGKSLAILLAKEGANVVIVARTEKHINDTVNFIKSFGGNVIGIKTDIRYSKDIKNMIKKVIEIFGKVDILVNNAGIAIRKSLIETSETEWNKIIDINLKGIFLCCKEVLPIMIKQNNGIIINVSSGAGKYGFPNFSAYCASKFGVIGLTESLSREVPKGIKIYVVCPGAVDTDMQRKVFPEGKGYELDRPEDVAQKIIKLCLPNCKIKNGETIELY